MYFTLCLCLNFSLPLSSQTEPLQQEVCEEVPDCRWTLQGAAAHCFLPQDGDETGHSAGGEWRGNQDAFCCAFHCFHAVSADSIVLKVIFIVMFFVCLFFTVLGTFRWTQFIYSLNCTTVVTLRPDMVV